MTDPEYDQFLDEELRSRRAAAARAAIVATDEDPSEEDIRDAQPRKTDAANAQAVMAEYGEAFRFVVEWGKWITWSGRHWTTEGARSELFRAVVRTAQLEYLRSKVRLQDLKNQIRVVALKHGETGPETEAAQERVKYETAVLKWHEQSQNSAKISACIQQLEGLLPIRFRELDANPWVWNAANCTIDLRTGEPRDHDRSDLLTVISETPYDPDAASPAWAAFLNQAMGNSAALVTYLQRLVGYAMTGVIKEHVMVFSYGLGGNGKGTFFHALQALFGEYATAVPRSLVFETRGVTPHPTELARLYGKRLAIAPEISEDVGFDEARINDLTGGDVIPCRRMNEDFWDLLPTHKLFVCGNSKPVIKSDNNGIWRRMRLIPWTFSAIGNEDTGLGDKLLAELPGILAWAVNGCLEWHRVGLAEPDAVLSAIAGYRDESNVLGEFLAGNCVIDHGGRCARKEFRKAYETWCEDLGHTAIGARKLGLRLRALGVTPSSVRQGGVVCDGWAGIRMMRQDERPGDAEATSSTLFS